MIIVGRLEFLYKIRLGIIRSKKLRKAVGGRKWNFEKLHHSKFFLSITGVVTIRTDPLEWYLDEFQLVSAFAYQSFEDVGKNITNSQRRKNLEYWFIHSNIIQSYSV